MACCPRLAGFSTIIYIYNNKKNGNVIHNPEIMLISVHSNDNNEDTIITYMCVGTI